MSTHGRRGTGASIQLSEGERFASRTAAGRILAETVAERYGSDDVVVFAVPPTGEPVADEVAKRLGVESHLFPVRDLRMPAIPELAVGAVSLTATVLDSDVVDELRIPEEDVAEQIEKGRAQLLEWARVVRSDQDNPVVRGRTIVLVDDGLGMSPARMRAALLALRKLEPKRAVVAVPVAAPGTLRALESDADDIICLSTPRPFQAVDYWYRDYGRSGVESVGAVSA